MSELTFGCEIECYLPTRVVESLRLHAGAYHRGATHGLFPGWSLQRDGSLPFVTGYTAIEFVSPVLSGAAGLKDVQEVCRRLMSMEAMVNRFCGFHVHVGVANAGFTPEEVRRLVHLVSNFELALFACTGTRERLQNHFCRPVRENSTYIRKFSDQHPELDAVQNEFQRYHTINLTNLSQPARRTLEFRVFSGLVEPARAIAYIRLCLGLVERALRVDRASKWASDRNLGLHKPTIHGRKEIKRLFETLGWNGKGATVFGGVGDDEPTLPKREELKKLMYRLGKKFDLGQA